MTGEKLYEWARITACCTLVVFCFGAGGEICGTFLETKTAAFGSKFPDNRVEDIEEVLSRLETTRAEGRNPQNSKGIPIAVLVTEDPTRSLLAVNMDTGKTLWKISPPIRSEITLGDDLVLFLSGTQISAHAIETGEPIWSYELKPGWDYHGADVGDGLVAISVGVGGQENNQYANGRLVALEAKTGVTVWDHVSGGGLLGKPLVHGGMVFVPWDRQKIAILDGTSGEEICRILASDFTINHVEADTNGVFYGTSSTRNAMSTLYRLDKNSTTGKQEGATAFRPPIDLVPGEPSFERDVFAKPIAGRSASEKIRFHWKPAPSEPGTIEMADNRYYLHYWKYIFAFDGNGEKVRWAYRSEKDIESIDVIDGFVLAVDNEGRLIAIDNKTGIAPWTLETGKTVVSGVFDANGFNPKGNGRKSLDPRTALKEIIWDKDNRMLPIRAYAALLLAKFEQPVVTRDLLQIYSNASTPKGLQDAVVKALAKRKIGAEYLVEALHMRYDFLEQTKPPPMNVVAPALANMKEKSAVPGLLSHLMDHETPVDHLPYIVGAIRELGDISAIPTLKQFLTLYHADSSFTEHEDTLALTAKSILTFEDKGAGHTFVATLRDDPQTLPVLRKHLRRLLNPEEAARAEVAAKAEALKKAKAEKDALALKEKQHRVPAALARGTINKTIAAYQQHFKPCVQAALGVSPTLTSIRMRFIITGSSGKASNLRILPNNIPNLDECLSSSLDMVSFPSFRHLRQMATYTISITGNPKPLPQKETTPAEETVEKDPDAFESILLPGEGNPGKATKAQDPDAFR